jgi:hypothetical protein
LNSKKVSMSPKVFRDIVHYILEGPA